EGARFEACDLDTGPLAIGGDIASAMRLPSKSVGRAAASAMAAAHVLEVRGERDRAEEILRLVAGFGEHLMRDPLPRGVLLNVNVPNLPYGELRGCVSTRMAASRFVETFHKRADPRGNSYYWMDGYLEPEGDPAGTDLHAVGEGWVSLTPIHFDLTHGDSLAHLGRWQLTGS
ncbi:MAG: hypothetical protein KJ579_04480, partial [Verrucomicrobia bacterium]|nr:hypothetical protein [Verrucomicrobiota bacterium]